MTASKIEWTGRSLPESPHELGMGNPPGAVEPRPDLSVIFGTVTANAGGNDVALFGPAAARHGQNVIPCRRGGRAIGAQAPERRRQGGLGVGTDRLCISAPSMGVLASLGTIGGAACVSGAVRRVGMFTAKPCHTDFGSGTPSVAHTATPLARFTKQRRFLLNPLVSRLCISAWVTHVATAIEPRSVDREHVNRLELPATGAPFFLADTTINKSRIARTSVSHGGNYKLKIESGHIREMPV